MHSNRFFIWFLIDFLLVFVFPFWLHGTRSEGSSLTMEAGGVGAFQTNSNYTPAKLSHGGRSQFDPGRVYSRCSTTQSIKKRCLKSAHRRLQLHGFTWYRG